MAKITVDAITALGIKADLYNLDEAAFALMAEDAIDTQSALLSGRIGLTVYNTTIEPTASYVARLELCLTAAELWQRRINVLLQSVQGTGQELNTTSEQQQRKDYLAEADDLRSRIIAGATTDSSSITFGAMITSTFSVRSSSDA